MALVQTVRGSIESKNLGVTLMHEHLNFDALGKDQAAAPFQDRTGSYNLDMLKKARDVGITTIVELTPWPHVAAIAEMAEKVPEVNIVLSTGSYLENCGHHVTRLNEAQFHDHLMRDLTTGFSGFMGIKAGVVKVAAEKSALTPWEQRTFRVAAEVHRLTGVPIATHAISGAREQLAVLRAAGADPSAVYSAHVEAEFGWEGRTVPQQADYLCDVAHTGGSLLFNNFGFEFDTPLADLVCLVNVLEERGFGDRILCSIDANLTVDAEGRVRLEAEDTRPACGRRTFAYAITDAVPMLLSSGISLQRVMRYLVDNPRRIFEAAAAARRPA